VKQLDFWVNSIGLNNSIQLNYELFGIIQILAFLIAKISKTTI
jgi:hypothetical protein